MKIGGIKISDLGDYEGGFMVEEFNYWNGDREPRYAVPAWEEAGYPALCGPFSTREAAQAAIDLSLWI